MFEYFFMRHLFRLVAFIALAAGNLHTASADEADTTRLYLRIPLNSGHTDVSESRLGLSLSHQSDDTTRDFGVDGLNLVNFEFSAEGVEKAAFMGVDAIAAYDVFYGETGQDLAEQGVTQDTLMFYVVTAGVAGGLAAACIVDWCHDDKKTVVVVHEDDPPSTPPTVVNPTDPIVPPYTPIGGGDPTDPTPPAVAAFTSHPFTAQRHVVLKWSDLGIGD